MVNFINIQHARIAHRAVGNGPDVVFVHGWPLHSETFRYIVPTLSKHFTCHLIDLPGAGQTEWSKQTPISILDHCDTLQKAVDALNLERYALLSHNSGGIFARHLAAADQGRVTGLILANTDIPDHQPLIVKLYVAMMAIPGTKYLLPHLMRLRAVRRSLLFGKSLFYNIDKFEGEFSDLFMHPLYTNRNVLDGQLRLIQAWDWSALDNLAELHAQIQAPVQLIWGRNDIVFPLKYGRHMVNSFGGTAELHVVQEAKLYVHEEQPETFNTVALPFLQQCFGIKPDPHALNGRSIQHV